MSALARLAKDWMETLLGRIRFSRHCGILLGSEGRKKRLKYYRGGEWPTQIDADGREFSFFTGAGVECPCTERKWQALAPRRICANNGRVFFHILKSQCVACEYHEPSRRGRRFPCCRWDRENIKRPSHAEIQQKALDDAAQMVQG